MRTWLLHARWALSVIAAVTALAVPAPADDVSFKVPFRFVVNGRTLPPGTYRVTSERSVLLARGDRDGAAVVTSRAESRAYPEPSLVFHKYGDRYALVQAWMGGGYGRVVPTSPLERELTATAPRASARTFESIVIPAR